jgi:maleate isomerase
MPTRIGLIVPSSNTTMETELPQLFAGLQGRAGSVFTFHSSRVRMRSVTQEELTRMVGASTTAAEQLADMRPDIVAYACLVAIMCQGPNYHEHAERELAKTMQASGSQAAVVSSAGALLEAIAALGARRIAMVAPYLKPLTRSVIGYIESAGIEVVGSVSLEVRDNVAVGCLPGERVLQAARSVGLDGAEAVVLSACVQMPSLQLVDRVEQELGLPVLTAATSTAFLIMRRLGLPTSVPKAGALLDGSH